MATGAEEYDKPPWAGGKPKKYALALAGAPYALAGSDVACAGTRGPRAWAMPCAPGGSLSVGHDVALTYLAAGAGASLRCNLGAGTYTVVGAGAVSARSARLDTGSYALMATAVQLVWRKTGTGGEGTELPLNPPSLADTGNVTTNGTNLQTAINAAALDDVLVLKAGVVYGRAGGFTFPAKGTGWDNRRVTLRSSRIGALPAGVRVGPSPGGMPQLVTTTKSATLTFSGARGYTLEGLEVTYTAAAQTGASVEMLVDLTNADADLTFDRCWVHPLESVTAPTSIYRAVSKGIAGIATIKNFRMTECYADGFAGWGYDNAPNWMACLESNGGTHLRVKNNFLQGFRTWYLQQGSTATDVVIQRNTFDQPAAWSSWVNPASGAQYMPDDHRELILYTAERALIVGNLFTGYTNRGPIGIFFDQDPGAGRFRYVRFLSNFLDGHLSHLAEIVLYHTPYAGSDLAFVNNLVRGSAQNPTAQSAWANEFGGPEGLIGTGDPLTAGHGLNILHNTIRSTQFCLLHYDDFHHSAFCDIRYNLSGPGANWFSNPDGSGFPNLLIEQNRFIGGAANRPSYVSSGQVYPSDAAAGLGNAAAGDAGGAITNYALTSGQGGADGPLALDHGCNIPDLQAALAGTSTDWDYPEQPRAFLTTTYAPPTGGTLFTPADVTQLTNALATCVLGDIIRLTAGVTYTGNFFLRNLTTGSGWVYLTTSDTAGLPAPGTRVAPADATHMPKLQSATTDPVFKTNPGAHHYRFVGLEITTTQASGTVNYMLINTDGNQTLAGMPSNLTFDRCYMHGHATWGAQRAIAMECASIAVIDSYFKDFKNADRTDCQALMASYGSGPFKIVNNHLEAATENVLFGGAHAYVPQMTPADIEIRGNYFFKDPAWMSTGQFAVKNFLEFKNAQRALVDGNTFENFPAQPPADQGMAITITPRNQSYQNPWARVTDITFTHNTILNNNGGGIVIKCDDNEAYSPGGSMSLPTDRILIQHNDMGTCGSATGSAIFQIFMGPVWGGPRHIVIDHNTCLSGRFFLAMESFGFQFPGAYPAQDFGTYNFVFTNNILARGTQNGGAGGMNDGWGGAGTSIQALLALYFPGALMRNNLMIGPEGGDPMPPGNFSVLTTADVGFLAGTHTPAPGSLGYRAGTEGLSLGAEGVGPPPPPPVPFPQQPIIDNTTRANENPLVGPPPGTLWTSTNAQLLSNQARAVAASAYTIMTAANTTSADCEFYVTVPVLPGSGGYLQTMARWNPGTNTAYYFYFSGYAGSGSTWSSAAMGRIVNGVDTPLAQITPGQFAPGDQIGLRVSGTTLTGYVNGTAVLTVADGTIAAAGRVGMLGSDATARLTSFGGGPL